MSTELRAPRNCRELISWQKGVRHGRRTDRLTAKFPNEEKFGLASQMRIAAVSIPSNLAESQARRTSGMVVQLIAHARGSTTKLDTQLTLSIELRVLHCG
ncbi:MAG: four helix bundle protein [Verrucomicrobiae bacterium]|nr:four helix bundle protein [Verrucomicrobiae bacterium]